MEKPADMVADDRVQDSMLGDTGSSSVSDAKGWTSAFPAVYEGSPGRALTEHRSSARSPEHQHPAKEG